MAEPPTTPPLAASVAAAFATFAALTTACFATESANPAMSTGFSVVVVVAVVVVVDAVVVSVVEVDVVVAVDVVDVVLVAVVLVADVLVTVVVVVVVVVSPASTTAGTGWSGFSSLFLTPSAFSLSRALSEACRASSFAAWLLVGLLLRVGAMRPMRPRPPMRPPAMLLEGPALVPPRRARGREEIETSTAQERHGNTMPGFLPQSFEGRTLCGIEDQSSE